MGKRRAQAWGRRPDANLRGRGASRPPWLRGPGQATNSGVLQSRKLFACVVSSRFFTPASDSGGAPASIDCGETGVLSPARRAHPPLRDIARCNRCSHYFQTALIRGEGHGPVGHARTSCTLSRMRAAWAGWLVR